MSNFFKWQIHKRIINRNLDIQIVPSVKLRCYSDSQSASAVIYCGLYDYDEMNFLLRYLRDEDLFLDIGANIGVYTLLAASKIKKGLIYSFEALPKNFARLTENLSLNQFKQVKPFSIAISNSTGNINLNITDKDCTPFIMPNRTENTVDRSSPKSIAVPTNTLDSLLQHESLNNLTLAKMDIEGAEILALKGATSLLNKQLPYVWILEINDTVNNFGHSKQDVVDLLEQYGYVLYYYDADTNNLHEIKLEQQQRKNVLAISKSALSFVQDRLKNTTEKSDKSINII
ncbi:MAG: FkbM family methyltransferase [Cyanobacteria bacterium J06621_15]